MRISWHMESYEQELRRAYTRTAGGSGRPVICPGTSCKLCNLIRTIRNFKDRYDEATVELADRMRAKEQYFSNVYFDPDYTKVVLFAYSAQIMNDLAKYQLHSTSDYKDFAHPTRGRLMVLDKTIGSNKRPQYGVTPKANIHQLPAGMPEPYNLKNVAELLEQGTEYLPQWRLDTKSHIVRFIGYGQDQTRFFKTLMLHWGIQHSEFELVQQGVYNPFVATEPETIGDTPHIQEVTSSQAAAPQEDIPMFDEPAQFVPGKGEVVSGREAKLEDTAVKLPTSSPSTTSPPSEMQTTPLPSEPPCKGKEFDPDDEECKNCDWKEPCKVEFLQRYGG